MNFLDLANLLDNDGNMQNEMMVMAFAATLLSTIPVLLGNEFDINVGLKKKRKKRETLLQVSLITIFWYWIYFFANFLIYTSLITFAIYFFFKEMWKNMENIVSTLSPSMPSLEIMNHSMDEDVDANKTKESYNQHSSNINSKFQNPEMNARNGTGNRLVVLKSVHDEEIGTSMYYSHLQNEE